MVKPIESKWFQVYIMLSTKKPIRSHLALCFHNVGVSKHQGRAAMEHQLLLHVGPNGVSPFLIPVVQGFEVKRCLQSSSNK